MIKLSYLLLMVMLLCSCKTMRPTSTNDLYPTAAVVTKYHNDWTIKHYQSRIKDFKASPLERRDIVFIGNSITEQGKNWSEKFQQAHIRNRGIAGDVTDGVLARLDEIIHCQPKAVFLLIGTNDLSNLHQENENRADIIYENNIPSAKYVAKNILKIAKKIHKGSPQTRLYIQTILPTSRENKKESIQLVNDIIRKHEHKGSYQVIDLYQYFIGQDELMNMTLSKDGTHLNEKGYDVWIHAEEGIIQELK